MYSLDEFGDMIADEARFGAYAEAIARTVRPGDTVVDVGCGPGMFALLACRAGARRVYAIEAGEVVQFARSLAAANGFADRIEFLHGTSTQLILPERADVVISDVRGALPLFGEAVSALEDARKRFLAEGGAFIPLRDTLFAALVEAETFYTRITAPWGTNANGLDLSSSLPLVLNSIYKTRFNGEQLVSNREPWCVLDYANGAQGRVAATLELKARRNSVVHGLVLWFEAVLAEGIGFSGAPGNPETVYGHVFLPWLTPVDMAEGDTVSAELRADRVGGEYIWRWDTRVPESAARPAREFHQSTFLGATFSSAALRRRAAEFVPVLTEAGQAERWLLQAMDGQAPLQEIARSAVQHFPHIFPRWEEAFKRASELSEK